MKKLALPFAVVTSMWCGNVSVAESLDIGSGVLLPAGHSMGTQKLLLNEQFGTLSHEQVTYIENRPVRPDTFHRIQTRHIQAQRDARTAITVMKGNAFMLKTAVSTGAAAVSGPMALATFVLVNKTMSAGLDALNEFAEDELKEQRENLLKSSLVKYEREEGVGAWKDLAGSPAEMIKEFERRGYLPKMNLDPELDADASIIVQQAMIRELAATDQKTLELLADQGKDIQDLEAKHGAAIKALQGGYAALWKTTQQHAETLASINRRMDSISSRMAEISSQVNENKENISENAADIEFLQETMFGRMSPSEQLKALRGGFFRGMSAEERDRLESRIEIAVERQALATDISKYAGYAANLQNIASNLGMDENLVEDLSTAAQLGNIAADAAVAYASGNYLAMASAVSNVAGLGKADPAAQRHQQIVGLLQNVLQDTAEIKQRLNTVLQNQEKLMQGQVAIMKQIEVLGKEIQVHHEELIKELETVVAEIRINREGIKELVLEGPKACRDIVKTFSAAARDYQEARSRFEEKLPDRFQTCLGKLPSVINNPGLSDSAFSAEWWLDPENVDNVAEDGRSKFLEKWSAYIRNISKLREKFGGDLPPEAFFASLLIPVADVAALQEKLGILQSTRSSLPVQWFDYFGHAGDPDVHQVYSDYYSVDAASWLIGLAERFHVYVELRDPHTPSRLVSIKKLLENDNKNREGVLLITNGLRRSDIMVAQQTLLSGDIVLPLIYDAYTYTGQENGVWRDRAVDALRNNEVLLKNFLLYAVSEQIAKLEGGIYDYHSALQSKENDLSKIRRIFPDEGIWEIEWRSEGNAQYLLCLRIHAEQCAWLPSVEAVQHGLLQYSEAFDMAVKLQERMLDHFIGAQAFDERFLPVTDDRLALARALILAKPESELDSLQYQNLEARNR